MKLHELSDRRLIDTIRVILGLRPIVNDDPRPRSEGGYVVGTHDYIRRELLCRRAQPDCTTCGGSGYYDGELEDLVCTCTGLPQRARGQGKKPGTGSNHRFVRPGPRG